MAPVHDILIIGGGGAGLRAAIAAAEINPQLDIALVSKVYPMRSHTVAAEGGTAAVIKENDSLEDHINDTITGSDWLADQDAVELLALSTKPPPSSSNWSIGAAPGAASPTAVSLYVRLAGCGSSGPGLLPTRPVSTCCTPCFKRP